MFSSQRVIRQAALFFIVWGPALPLPAQTAANGNADRALTSVTPATPHFRNYVPMTQRERAKYYWQHLFSLEATVRAAAGAGLNQWANVPEEWGQGGAGYARRFASSYGDHIIQSTTMYGVSTVFHEDNRYYSSGRIGTKNRLKYAIRSSFMARHEDGTQHVSVSRLSSYAVAAIGSRAWQPDSTRGPLHAADSFAISVGVEAGFNVAREFLPGILHARPPVD